MHSHDLAGFHIQKILQQLIRQVGSRDLEIGHGAIHPAHLKNTVLRKGKTGRCNKAIKSIKHTITELDRSKIEEQKKAVRSGYEMDIIPSDLATYGKDAKALLKELQSQNDVHIVSGTASSDARYVPHG